MGRDRKHARDAGGHARLLPLPRLALTEPLDVSVVVPSHGSARTVPALARALAAQTLDPSRWELIVVDTHADGTKRVLDEIAAGWDGPELRVLHGPFREGPGAKRNFGAAAARGTLIAFTDSDCEPEPDWLERLVELSEGADVIQGATLPPDEAPWHPFGHRIHVTGDSGLHETCNIAYRRELFGRLGGFDTRYFRAYGLPFGEDADLGWRARRAGARYRFAPEVVVRHPVGADNMRSHLREQWLARGFPRLARDVPELRRSLFWRELFLSQRSASFAAAALGLVLLRRLPLAVLLTLPYLVLLRRSARGRDPLRIAVDASRFVASDATLAAALWSSSAVNRSAVL